MNVLDVYKILNDFAPFSTQCDFDHSGLQVGDYDAPVTGILAAVDLDGAVIDEAVEHGCNLIVVHHPPIWQPLPTLVAQDYTQYLVRRLVSLGINLIAAHTNVDKCEGGNCDALIRKLGGVPCGHLHSDECAHTFMMSSVTMSDFVNRVRELLPDPFAYGVGPDEMVWGGALCTGAGFSREALEECNQEGLVYLTGEVKEHDLRAAQDMGARLIVFGHFASERIFVDIMVNLFAQNGVKCLASRQDTPCRLYKKD